MAGEAESRIRCGECGVALDEPSGLPVEKRTPCPSCGSKNRVVVAPPIEAHIRMRSRARGRLIRAWDGVSLTLFGVIYAIAVTVAGVVVAMVGTGGSPWWWATYAVVSIGMLALALLVFPQVVIGWMRRLVDRATKAQWGSK
jgi:hypothetical protein